MKDDCLENNENIKRINNKGYMAIIGILFFVIGYGAAIITITFPISTYSIEKAGQFGDSFGLVTALFSGLAFAGLIWAILLQREDLNQQVKVLKQQEEALSKQYAALENQKNEMMKQRFDSVFFEMIKIHNEIANTLVLEYQPEHKGPKALKEVLRRYLSLVGAPVKGEDNLISNVNQFVDRVKTDLEHYLNNLLALMRIVDTSGAVSSLEKQYYFNIINAQFSHYEKVIFYCFALSGNQGKLKDELMLYVNKYGLLKGFTSKNYIPDYVIEGNYIEKWQ